MMLNSVKETALMIHNAVMSNENESFTLMDIMQMIPMRSKRTVWEYVEMYYPLVSKGVSGKPSVYKKINNFDLFDTFPTADDVNKLKFGKRLHDKTKLYKSVIANMDNVFTLNCFHSAMKLKGNPISTDGAWSYLNRHGAELGLIKINKYTYKKIGDSQMPKIPELKQQPIEIPSCNNLIQSFLLLSNEEKAKLVSTLMPIVTEQELLAKFNELYPNYILADAKEKDKLFHPLIGEVEIQTASKNKLSFYGHGQSWECTRNGNLIVNGKVEKRRILFYDLNDYIEYMKTN